ncbi:HNH endonuclease signature motif containing protein [Arthrobacter sp. Sr24]
MSNPENVPGDRGYKATQDVVTLLSAITLPSIEPFGTDSPLLEGIALDAPASMSGPEQPSKLGVARAQYDTSIAALEVLKRIEDRLAATKAALVANLMAAAAIEAQASFLDSWQSGIYESSAHSELALTLLIPERTAATLAHHSTELVNNYPQTFQLLRTGVISLRHAWTIVDEVETLLETPGISTADVAAFEQRLLHLAPGTSAASFTPKARRAREATHPESIRTRTKTAHSQRAMTLGPGKDGMSWLTLHLPSLAAEGIWVKCTRTARALKNLPRTGENAESQSSQSGENSQASHSENRTLTQLRVDVAAALLLGQQPLPGFSAENSGGNIPASSTTTSTGAGAGNDSNTGARPATGGDTRASDPSRSDPAATETGSSAADPANARPPVGIESDSGLSASGHSASAGGGAPPTAWKGDGSGYAKGMVDGIAENPGQEYMDQLEALQSNKLVADPPLPEATILVTVPFLGAMGITDEPAELAGSTTCSGPVPLDIARRLMASAGSFLRVLTDPVTGEPLGLHPERYQLRESDKAVLRAISGGCYFPGCPNPAMDTETDHLKAYGNGGQTTMENLRPACKRHHALRHFKDDKDRNGNYRSIQDPYRHVLRLRGWTPTLELDGTVSWTAPSGAKHRAPGKDSRPPIYPPWLEKRVDTAASPAPPTSTLAAESAPPPTPVDPSNPGKRAKHAAVSDSSSSPFEQLLVSYIKKHNC